MFIDLRRFRGGRYDGGFWRVPPQLACAVVIARKILSFRVGRWVDGNADVVDSN